MKCLNCNSLLYKVTYNQLFCCDRCRQVYRKKEYVEIKKKERRVSIDDIERLEGEEWKHLLENEYYISNYGRIYSAAFRKFFKLRVDKYGYNQVSLKKISSSPLTVHRLVAKSFIPNPENKPQVNHINGIKTDNRVENLEWCTVKENIRHSIENNLKRVAVNFKRLNVQQPKRRKPVQQIDEKGNIIAEFESGKEASVKLGINTVYISRCCKGKQKYAFGKFFRFKE